VRFVEPYGEPGSGAIEVIDDGHGMSAETVEETWMEPATLFRKRNPRSEKLGRRVLGEKGIGRFATSRLAEALEVVTRRRGDTLETHAYFDWSAFDDEDSYLDEVKAEFWEDDPVELAPGGSIDLLWPHERPPTRRQNGTLLRMARLREGWSDEEFRQLRVGLARLISPFDYDASESGFQILLDVPEHEELSGRVEPPELLQHPPYLLRGSIRAGGSYKFNIHLPNGKPVRVAGKFLVGGRTPTCGPVAVELRVWDRDAPSMRTLASERGGTVKAVREDLDEAAGINVYRDSFRVLPYGERRNDWLRLDLRRVQNPTLRLSNNQIVGYVLISADGNPELRDQSNREGLIENRAYDDLTDLVRQALAELETRRYTARRPASGAPAERGGIFTSFSLSPLRTYIRQHHPGDQRLLDLVGDAAEDLAQRVEEVQDVIARYRRLATLGQLIDIVLHDGRAPVAKIGNEAKLGLRDIERQLNGKLVPRLGERLSAIRTQSDVLAIVFRRIEPFGGRRRGRPRRILVEEIIAETFAVVQTEIDRLGVDVSLPKGEHVVSVDPAELQEVILNLLQNSLWWLRDLPEGDREIKVRVRRPDGRLEIIFSDNGPGVDPEFADRIFDPYFSTKPSGVGLGLTIAGEIVSEYYAGELELVETGPLPGATFRITLRRRI
jgi:signal transduction histidine kinase